MLEIISDKLKIDLPHSVVSNDVKLKTFADQTPCLTRELHRHMLIFNLTRNKSNDSSCCA